MNHTINVFVPEIMRDICDNAVTRLGAVFPEFSFAKEGDSITVVCTENVDDELLKQEILNAIYREKIFQKTLPIREKIFGG
jgi:hypothetical protein